MELFQHHRGLLWAMYKLFFTFGIALVTDLEIHVLLCKHKKCICNFGVCNNRVLSKQYPVDKHLREACSG